MADDPLNRGGSTLTAAITGRSAGSPRQIAGGRRASIREARYRPGVDLVNARANLMTG